MKRRSRCSITQGLLFFTLITGVTLRSCLVLLVSLKWLGTGLSRSESTSAPTSALVWPAYCTKKRCQKTKQAWCCLSLDPFFWWTKKHIYWLIAPMMMNLSRVKEEYISAILTQIQYLHLSKTMLSPDQVDKVHQTDKDNRRTSMLAILRFFDCPRMSICYWILVFDEP